MATKQRKSLEEIEAQITGGEPKFPNEVITESQMMAALNWFSKNRDGKQASKYITDYLKKQKIKVAADVINRQNSTFGYLCRLKSTGGKLSDKHEAKFTEYMDAMVAAVSKPVEVKEDKKPTVSIQDRLAEKISEIIGELEGTIDDYILGQFKKSPVPYGVMHGMNAKGMHANKISEWAKYRRAQFEEALESDDPQIKEGWSNFNKVQLKKLIAYCDLIITDCIKISGESMASRKPRKRKVKSPDQLVAKVKILESDETFKLKSVPAKDIIGALQLWVFNVKTKKLGVYNAEDAGGLSVKGSSLLNYNEGKSVTKTLRKPDVVLPEVLKGGKVFLRNVMENLTTKDSPANGRLNGDTILLRVIK